MALHFLIFGFPEFASACEKSAQCNRLKQILESHDLKGTTLTFDHGEPIIITYPEFVSPFKKSVYSINFFVRYSSQFKSLVTKVATLIFLDNTHVNNLLSALNFWYQHAK